MKIELSENDLHLWLLPFDSQAGLDCLQSGRVDILHKEEKERFDRFKVDNAKVEFLCSRMLIRFLLGLYTDRAADTIQIVADDMGRPFLYHQSTRLPLYFSLSHTRNFICCLFSLQEKAGCDVEKKRQRRYQGDLSGHVFSDKELAFYHGLAPEEQELFFFFSWTLKEAYIKAEGKGLRIPLTSLSFTHAMWEKRSSRLAPIPEIPERLWHFHSLSPGQNSIAGVATRTPNAQLSVYSATLDNDKIHRIQ